MELGISTAIRCKVESEGQVSVPAKTLIELINSFPNEAITLESSEGEILVSTEHYRTKIKTLPSDEFPHIPLVVDGYNLVIKSEVLKTAIDSVLFAASTSETQPEMSGVYGFSDELNNLRFVATDRYRLGEKTLKGIALPKGVILPHRTAAETSRILAGRDEAVNIIVTDNQISFSMEDVIIISRLIDGQYPDYQQIVPQTFNTTVTLSRKELLSAMKTSAIFFPH